MMSSQPSAVTDVRVPKLAVRNRVANDASNPSDNASQTTGSSHSSTRTASVRRDRGTSDASKPSSMEAGARRSGSSQEKQPQQQQGKEKKKGGMLGFLTLKEPSTNALEQFAQQQKKAAAVKGGRATAASLTSPPQQKLPEHVPKVNSKWDGLPEDARKKLDHQRKKSHETGSSLYTTNTRQTQRSRGSSSSSSTSTRRPIGSMSSRPTSMSSTVRSGQKYTVIKPHVAYDTTTPITMHDDVSGLPSPMASPSESGNREGYFSATDPQMVHPALRPAAVDRSPYQDARSVRRVSGAVPAELAGRAIAELPGDGPAELPGDEPPQMAGDEPAYITTPSASPLTPPMDVLTEQIPRVITSGMHRDAPETIWYSDSDHDGADGRVSDSDVLTTNLPMPFGKRRPLEYIAESPIEYPDTPEDWPLATSATRAADTPNADDTADATDTPTPTPSISIPTDTTPPPTCPLPPIPTNTSSRPLLAPTSIYSKYNNRPASIAPSVADSVASSAASTIDWPLPPTARLAMGGNTGPTPRKADVAPWERFDGKAAAMGVPAGRPLASTRAPANNDTTAPKVKRFSGLLNRK